MKPRTLLAMLLVIAALGGFIFFYEKDLPSTDERRELDKKVLRLEDDEVRAVTIEWQDREVRLERAAAEASEDGGDSDGAQAPADWRIVEPIAARADRAAVEAVISTLTGLEKKRTLEDVDRDAAGLEDPEIRVKLATGDGETVLAVGAPVPASSDRIVAVAGDAYQVRGGFVSDLTKDPGEWRDKKLFTAGRDDVERVTLEGAGESGATRVLLARRGGDFWIESPLTDRADGDQVGDLLTGVTGLRVKTFLDDAPLSDEALGLAPPAAVVEAVLADQAEPFRIELGEVAGDGETRYGRAGGQLFEIETDLIDAVARAPGEWRDKGLTALEVFKIESARLTDGDGELELRRDGADWKRGDERIDYTTASDLLYALADARAGEVVERAEAEARGHRFDDPELEVTLATTEVEEELALYGAVDGISAAVSGGRDAVLLLDSETIDKIRQELADLRATEALAEEGSQEIAPEELGEE